MMLSAHSMDAVKLCSAPKSTASLHISASSKILKSSLEEGL